jgi:hypothetical protein
LNKCIPTPTNISTKSEPDREKMVLVLQQLLLANRVFLFLEDPAKLLLNFTT